MNPKILAEILACVVFRPHPSLPEMCRICGMHRELHDRKRELLEGLA